jgi:glycosyltransferase involved in cell wall biosynthesis
VRQTVPDVRFVRVGSQLSSELREQFGKALEPRSLLELGHVSDQELSGLYHKAAALVFPSREEGFGLPLLEAMAAGCPVVSSNAASLPEAGGEAAAYFDPDVPEEAVRALLRVLNDTAFADELRRQGLERVSQFTWLRHFQDVLRAYHQVLCCGD